MPINTVTLNQLLDLFESFVDNHPLIRDYGYGPTSEIGETKKMDYPYMWVSHQSDSTIVLNNKTQTPEIAFYILFMDLVNDSNLTSDVSGENSTNGQEVLSDMFQLLQDLIITVNTTWNTYGISLTGDVRCFPAEDETTDRVNGWVGELNLRVTYQNNNCLNVIPTTLGSASLTPIYLTCDTLSDCSTFINLSASVAEHATDISEISQSVVQNTNDITVLQNQTSYTGSFTGSFTGDGSGLTGVGGGENFATDDLTVTADRTHDMAGNDMKFNLFSTTGKFILSSGQGGYGNFNFTPYNSTSNGVARIDNGLSYIQFRANYGAEVNKLSINKTLNSTAPTLGVQGTGATSATTNTLLENSSGTDLLKLDDDGTFELKNGSQTNFYAQGSSNRLSMGMGATTDATAFLAIRNAANRPSALVLQDSSGNDQVLLGISATFKHSSSGDDQHVMRSQSGVTKFEQYHNNTNIMAFRSNGTSFMTGNFTFGENVAAGARVRVKGSGNTSSTTNLLLENSDGTELMKVLDDGEITITGGVTGSSFTGSFVGDGSGLTGISGDNFATADLTFTGNRTHDLGNNQLLIDGDTNGGTSTSFRVNTNGETLGVKSFFQIDDEGLVEIRGNNATNGALKIYEDRSTNVVFQVGTQGHGFWLQRSGNPITIGQYNASRVVHRNNYHSFETSTSTEIHRLRTQGGSTTSFLMGTGFGTGTLTIGATAPVGTEDISLQGETLVRGLGSTSATKSLVVQNSSGTKSLQIDDAGNIWNTGGGAVASNTVFGYNSLPTATGAANTVFGYDAMKSATSARYNVAIGHKALEDITFGDNNIAIGRLAGNSIFGGGENNVLIGSSAGTAITSGDHHIAIGTSAGSTVTVVKYGISIGGLSNGGGNASIALGYQGKTTANYSMCFNSSQGSRTNTTANSLEVYVDNVGTDAVFKVAQTADSYYAGSGSFGFGTTTPDASAAVDIESTTKGFLPPRMTTTERDAISTPAAGLVVFNTTTNKHQGYDGTTWNDFY